MTSEQEKEVAEELELRSYAEWQRRALAMDEMRERGAVRNVTVVRAEKEELPQEEQEEWLTFEEEMEAHLAWYALYCTALHCTLPHSRVPHCAEVCARLMMVDAFCVRAAQGGVACYGGALGARVRRP